jgi:hypothetical protein
MIIGTVPPNSVTTISEPVQTGNYSASYNNGSQTYISMFGINTASSIGFPTSFDITMPTLTTQVTTTWGATAGAAAHQVVLRDNSGNPLDPVRQSGYITSSSYSFTGLSLSAGMPYQACIQSYSQNPSTSTGAGQINRSVWCKTFTTQTAVVTIDSIEIVMPPAATDGKLAIGESFVFSAQALDSNSVVIPGQNFTWNFNGDPSEIVSQTNTTITIKPRRFGSFSLEAVAVSNTNKKKNTSLAFYGLLARAGTVKEAGVGASPSLLPQLLVWFKGKDGSGSGSTPVSIQGCPNFPSNDPQVMAFSVSLNNNDPADLTLDNITATSASCSASVTVNSKTYTAPFSIDTSSIHQPATGIMANANTATTATVAWNPVSGSAFYELAISEDDDNDDLIGNILNASSPQNVSLNESLQILDNYTVCVGSYDKNPRDNTSVFAQINYSHSCITFTYNLPVTSVDINFITPLIDGSKMQIGETYTVTATAKNGSTPLSGISFNWSEATTGFTIVSFNPNGTATVTPKRLLSAYSITATAQSNGVSGSKSNILLFGLQVVGGTLTTNNTPNPNGLYFNLNFRDKNGATASDESVNISCSGGVNTNPVLFTTAQAFLLLPSVPNNPICTGDFTLNSVQYETPVFTINTSQTLAKTTNIINSVPNVGQVKLDWPAVVGASRYKVIVYPLLGAPLISPYLTTNTHTYTGALNPSSTVCVITYSLNPTDSTVVSSAQPNVSEFCKFF